MQLQTVNLNLLGVMVARKLDIWLEFAYLRTSRKLQDKGVVETKTSAGFKTAVAISDESSTEEFLHSVFQLGKANPKFIITTFINGVQGDMEADSGAEWSTISWSVFQDKLLNVCKLVPSSVKLHQYDKSPLS